METLSASETLCEWKPLTTVDSIHKGQALQNFDSVSRTAVEQQVELTAIWDAIANK